MEKTLRLSLFGTLKACEKAKDILQKQPFIQSLSASNDLRFLHIQSDAHVSECGLVALLADSGLDGFACIPAGNQASSRNGFEFSL